MKQSSHARASVPVAISDWSTTQPIEVREIVSVMLDGNSFQPFLAPPNELHIKPHRLWDQLYSGGEEIEFNWKKEEQLSSALDRLVVLAEAELRENLDRQNQDMVSHDDGRLLHWSWIGSRIVIYPAVGRSWTNGYVGHSDYFLASILHDERLRALQLETGAAADGIFGGESASALEEYLIRGKAIDPLSIHADSLRYTWIVNQFMKRQQSNDLPWILPVDLEPPLSEKYSR